MHNVSLTCEFEDGNPYLQGTRIRVGARNVFDKDPPLVAAGYPATTYNP